MDTAKKVSKKKWLLIGLGGIAMLMCLCIVVAALLPDADEQPATNAEVASVSTEITEDSAAENKDEEETAVTETKAPTKPPAPSRTPAPTKTAAPTRTATATSDPNLVRPGTYLVGTEINPGIYKGDRASCYWERLKDLTGSFDAIIANGNSEGQFYVEVKEGDFAFNIDCEIYPLELLPPPSGEFLKTVGPGLYLVGREIQPGIYKGESDGCYWERLKDVSGGFDPIIANGNSDGQFYLRAKEGDFALSTDCEITLLETPLPEHTGEYPETIQPGVYLVGYDIQPGTYKGESDGCYWERLKDVSGGFDPIIANGNSDGQFYVQVSPNDYALSTDCSLARTGD